MMECVNNKPFRKYNFFLDLRNSPQIGTELTKYINTLGGRIDAFFNRNVKYIVTDRARKEWPNKYVSDQLSTPNSKLTIDFDNHSTLSTSSHINNNKVDLFSRGKLLLSKTAAPHPVVTIKPMDNAVTNKTTTDVLELARIWNIKIIPAFDMIEFCKKHLNLSPNREQNALNQIKVFHLRSPYVKVEENFCRYKPVYKELNEWPLINFESTHDMCPFVKRKSQKLKTHYSASFDDNNKIVHQNNAKEKRDGLAKKLTNLVNNNKKRIPNYCEICQLEYEDIKLHLKSETHDSYSRNAENYKELESVISSLPHFCEISGNGYCCKEFSNGNQDAFDSDEELPCSPFQSTPNMSTTIQLSGPKVKHKTFLAIHDLIAQKQSMSKDLHENELINAQTTHDANCNDDDSDLVIASVLSFNGKNRLLTKILDNSLGNNDCDKSEEYMIVS